MTKETGTLAELNVQPGDVVEWINRGSTHTVEKAKRIAEGQFFSAISAELSGYGDAIFGGEQFHIISRASDTPKTWGEMTDAEKGALLLARHEGKKIEFNYEGSEWEVGNPSWLNEVCYRIKPEPKRKTVKMYGHGAGADGVWVFGEGMNDGDTHCVTFDTLDEPVLDSIRMEKLK